MTKHGLDMEQRLALHTDRSGGPDACWPWIGARDPDGYGHIRISRTRTPSAHRIAWETKNGPIPDGMVVRHTCDNPPCVNPGHLILGTNLDNIRDKMSRKRHRGPGPGAQNHQAKLTPEQVADMRSRHAVGDVTQYELAAEFGVSQSHVWRILHGKNWLAEPQAKAYLPPQPSRWESA